jgi:undecaprenyl-diphosphatase
MTRATPIRAAVVGSTATRLTIVLSAIVIALVVAVGFVVVNAPGWSTFELSALQDLSRAHSPVATTIALALNWTFAANQAAVIIAATALIVALTTRSTTTTAIFLALVILPWLGSAGIKALIHRPRPNPALLADPILGTLHSFSYPSGHTTISAALGLAIVVTIRSGRWRRIVTVATGVVVLAVAWSRVYLGVHYVTDVVAAMVYTTAAVTLLAALSRGLRRREVSRVRIG